MPNGSSGPGHYSGGNSSSDKRDSERSTVEKMQPGTDQSETETHQRITDGEGV